MVRSLVVGILLLFAAGCVAPAPAADPLPPELTGNETTGEKVALVHQWCVALANQRCPGATLRCDAYRPAFIKPCLIRAGVPPEYVIALTIPG